MKDRIAEVFPEVNEIRDKSLRQKVIAVWAESIESNRWQPEELNKIPFTLLAGECSICFVEHVRTCVRMCIEVEKILVDAYGDRADIDHDTLVAGALLADVGKMCEYEKRPDGSIVKGYAGDMLRHPFSGVGLCYKHGIPNEVMHIVATHSKEGDHVPRSRESIIFHHADFIDFDLAKQAGK